MADPIRRSAGWNRLVTAGVVVSAIACGACVFDGAGSDEPYCNTFDVPARPDEDGAPTVEEVIRRVADGEVTGEPGPDDLIDPDFGDRLLDPAPSEVAEDVELVLRSLTGSSAAVGATHERAARAVIDDADERCG